MVNIDDAKLVRSLDPAINIKQIQKAGLGAGASGSFFFFTKDKKFILKTISKKEIDHMIRQLPNYYEHLDLNNDSFIARNYGIFEVSIDKFSTLHVMIMANTLPQVSGSCLHYTFDLKGSTVNR